MKDTLISLVENAQKTGGIVTFTDGLSAPAADLLWTELGATILKAYDDLNKEGVEVLLDIRKVDYSARDAVDAKEEECHCNA